MALRWLSLLPLVAIFSMLNLSLSAPCYGSSTCFGQRLSIRGTSVPKTEQTGRIEWIETKDPRLTIDTRLTVESPENAGRPIGNPFVVHEADYPMLKPSDPIPKDYPIRYTIPTNPVWKNKGFLGPFADNKRTYYKSAESIRPEDVPQ